jgi:RNA polymerase sigma-70 factor, ECF subfamily
LEKSDEELVRETLSGSLGAFDDLMVRYQRLVYKIALGYGRGREQALDITQNVFLRIYQKLGSLREDGNFKSWILTIAFRESINWLRQQRRHRDPEPVEEDALLFSETPSQEDSGLRQERAEYLLRSLSCLNPRHRFVVILRYYEDMSIKAISEAAGCSEMVVKNMLYRSLEKLKLKLVQTGRVSQ